jgi:DNA-binding response OmpR family regulator
VAWTVAVARTVLLVAHGPALRTTVKLHLGEPGAFEFVEAGDVAGAVALLRRRDVQLVIADVGDAEVRELAAALATHRARPALVAVADRAARGPTPAGCILVKRPVTWPRLRAAMRAALGDA